jgi:hypothetical protein
LIEQFIIYADDFAEGFEIMDTLAEAETIAHDLWEPSSIWRLVDGERHERVSEFEGLRAKVNAGIPYTPPSTARRR